MNYTVDQELLTEIYDLLYFLGLRATRTHFFHLSFAIYIAVQNPDRLLSMTKWLHPDVADHYATSWKAVERNIRTAIARVWLSHREELCDLAGYQIDRRPTPSTFIKILAGVLSSNTAA